VVVGEIGDHVARTLTAMGGAIDVVRQLAAQASSTPCDAADATRRIVVSRAALAAAHRETQVSDWHELELTDGKRIAYANIG
jgi:hypothetical protein